MSNIVPVVLISSDAWACAAAVTLQSMLDHYQGEEPLKVYLFSTDMSEENVRRFLSYNSNKVDIEVIKVDDSAYEQFRVEGYTVPPVSFLKIQLQDVLPQYDRIIYLDIDLLIKKDISPLMTIDLDGYYLAGIADIAAMLRLRWHKRLHRMRYANAGVLVLNAKKMREEKIYQKCTSAYLAHRGEYQCYEQDTFNAVFNDEIKFLPLTWNLMTYNLIFPHDWERITINEINTFCGTDYKSFQELEDDAAIIHLTNWMKPWEYKDCYMSEEWLSVYKRTPFAGIPLRLKDNPQITQPAQRKHIITRKGPFVKDWTEENTVLKLWRIPLVEKIKEGWRTRFKLFGIPVIKREWAQFEERTYIFGMCVRIRPHWPAIKERADYLFGRLGFYVVNMVSPAENSAEPYAAWSAQISKLRELDSAVAKEG